MVLNHTRLHATGIRAKLKYQFFKGGTKLNRLKYDAKKCTGCHLCEVACSGKKEKVFNYHKARLKIECYYPSSNELKRKGHVCNLCQLCIKKCPADALSLENGHLVIDRVECVNCNICVEVCPQQAIKVDADDNILICDLCDGNPECVQWCPHGALVYSIKAEEVAKDELLSE